jgi:hypothetical protein
MISGRHKYLTHKKHSYNATNYLGPCSVYWRSRLQISAQIPAIRTENYFYISYSDTCRSVKLIGYDHFLSILLFNTIQSQRVVESSWNVMGHDDARVGKWRGNWRMECVASTLHTTSEHGVSSISTADAHTSTVSSRLNWRPCLFKWTRPFRRKTKSGFCACGITFQTYSNILK